MHKMTHLLEIRRKAAGLPRFVVLENGEVDAWQLTGTTPVMVAIEDGQPYRRALKRWGKGTSWWFVDLTEEMCRRSAVETGDVVQVEITQLESTTAPEILAILAESLDAQVRWDELTPGRKRMLNEHVMAAKQAATRVRRARKAFGLNDA